MSKKFNKNNDDSMNFAEIFAGKDTKKDQKTESFADLLEEYSDIDFEIHKREKESSAEEQKEFFRPRSENVLPEFQIDLHGLTQDEAEKVVETNVRAMKSGRIYKIRIVTGKGLHSKNSPVLRNAIDILLRQLKKEGCCSKIEWDKKSVEESGQVDVTV
ncbi:Smr/MutS family protein [bacterium]|nr:Smr/MutS family protein [bacterium]